MNFNEINDALRRYFDLQAGQVNVQGVHPTIIVTQSLDDFLGNRLGSLYSMRTGVTAAAGKYQAIEIRNPTANTGVDVEIVEVALSSASGTVLYHGVSSSTTTTDRGAGYSLDLRSIVSGSGYRSVAHMHDEDDAALGIAATQGELRQRATGFGLVWPCSIYVAPGYGYRFATAAVNQGITGQIIWREVPRVQRP